jgi:hypothetical protein
LRNEECPTQRGAILKHDYVFVNAITPRSPIDSARSFIALLQQREVTPRELFNKMDITRREARYCSAISACGSAYLYPRKTGPYPQASEK